MKVIIERNYEVDGVEIYFEYKPETKVINDLKKQRWRWNASKRCWYNYYSEAHMEYAREIKDRMNPKMKRTSGMKWFWWKKYRQPIGTKLPTRRVSSNEFVIKKNSFTKKDLEEIKEVCAIFTVVTLDYKYINVCVPAFYNKRNKTFYLYTADYEAVQRKGIVLCKENTIYRSRKKKEEKNFDYSNLEMKSIFYEFGYNVEARNGLSHLQRCNILVQMMNARIVKKAEVLSFLDWLIRTRGGKENMRKAVEKWQEDRDWIAQFKLNSLASFHVFNIRETIYITHER